MLPYVMRQAGKPLYQTRLCKHLSQRVGMVKLLNFRQGLIRKRPLLELAKPGNETELSEGELWVFGYGSLMWNPAINVVDSKKAHVRGYHRTFCLTLGAGRGTPQMPGLMLAIDRGGSCTGVAHCIAAGQVESELGVLWLREMVSGAYEPRWVSADVEGVKRLRVLTFVINRSHPRYEGHLAPDVAARRIAAAQGILGSNREYLYRTVRHLAELGIEDGPMHALERHVRILANETNATGD
jgi:cation transport protein ChaC